MIFLLLKKLKTENVPKMSATIIGKLYFHTCVVLSFPTTSIIFHLKQKMALVRAENNAELYIGTYLKEENP